MYGSCHENDDRRLLIRSCSEARKIAAREGTTLRALVEQGLRQVVAQKKKPQKRFKLRDASFGGAGCARN